MTAMAGFQVGAALAKGLYPAVGAQGAAGLRLGFGALILIAVLRPWRNWPKGKPLAPLLGLGLCTGGAVVFFYLAIDRLPLGVAIALQFLGPLSVAVLGSRKAVHLLWAGLAAVGVWSLVGSGRSAGPVDLLGVAFALAAAASWAGYILTGRVAGAAFGPSAAAVSTGIAALVVLPVSAMHAGAALISPAILPLALLVAVVATALPFSLEVYALPRLPARTFAVFTSLEPVFGVLSGLVILHERLSALQVVGVALVIAAAAGSAWSAAERAPVVE